MAQIGNILSGFLQGFGPTFFQQRQKRKEEETRKEQTQFQVMKYALDKAGEENNAPAMAHILRSMDEFTANSGGGKKGAQARQNIFSSLADVIEKGLPTGESQTTVTPEAQQAQSNINTTIQSGGDLLGVSRPRLSTEQTPIRRSFFKSPQEKNQEEIDKQLGLQKALLPGKIELEQNEQKAMQERQVAVEGEKAKHRQSLQQLMSQDRIEKDTESAAYAYSQGYGVPIDVARVEVGKLITQKRQKDLEDVDSRIETRKSQLDIANKRIEGQLEHWKKIEDHFEVLQSQGKRRLDQADTRMRAQYGQGKAIQQQIKNITNEMNSIVSQQNRERGIMSNSMVSLEERNAAKARFMELDKQYDLRMQKRDELSNQLDSFNIDIPDSSSSSSSGNSGSGKRLNKKSNNNDPLGIR